MSQTSTASLTRAERLPLSGLLALAMTGFIAILSETLPAGLLDQIADGMHISQAMAGQWVTAYALGSLLTAIPLVTLTQGWYRRRALLLAIVGFVLFNGLTAISPSNTLTLLLRFLTGAAAGLAWGLIAGHARRMVPAALQGAGDGRGHARPADCAVIGFADCHMAGSGAWLARHLRRGHAGGAAVGGVGAQSCA